MYLYLLVVSSIMSGRIMDGNTGKPLVGANVLVVGENIDMFGKNIRLYDCDDYTREFYRNIGIVQPEG